MSLSRELDDLEGGGAGHYDSSSVPSAQGSPLKRGGTAAPKAAVGLRADSPSKDRVRGLAPLLATVNAELSAAAAAAAAAGVSGKHNLRTRLALCLAALLVGVAGAAFLAYDR